MNNRAKIFLNSGTAIADFNPDRFIGRLSCCNCRQQQSPIGRQKSIAGPLYGIYNPNQSSLTGIGNMLFFMIPLLMTGLSVGFAFKTGLFNIGASGQFMAGSYVAILLARKLTGIPNSWRWLVALAGAALAGMLLASIAGILKAFRNVNEVITSIMLNYTSMYLVNHLIRATGLYDPLKNRTLPVRQKFQVRFGQALP